MSKFSVELKHRNGHRYGSFAIGSAQGDFPSQAATSTNSNHMRVVGRTVDLGTPFLEKIYRTNLTVLSDAAVLQEEAKKLQKFVSDNTDKICLLSVAGAKSKRFDRVINELLIKLQVAAGLRFIKVYMKSNRDPLGELGHYSSLIPEDRFLLPVIDEKLKNSNFKALYLKMLDKVPIIGFLGRDISDTGDINQNHLFIRSRTNDKVLRLVSDITKKATGGMVKSYLFKWMGYDVFSFSARKTTYTIKRPLEIIRNHRFVLLSQNNSVPCAVFPNKKLVETVTHFERDEKETVPCSLYSLKELNKELKTLHDDMTDEELEKLLEADVKNLTPGT